MRSPKRYTNETFTKRVDHEGGGRHRTRRAMPEPAVCEICGDVYADRRWSKPHPESVSEKHPHFRPPARVTCPACQRQQNHEPGGFVYLKGAFAAAHSDELIRLLHNEAARAAEDNPLARIMEWKTDANGMLTVLTTTEHLAQRFGHALEKAYHGKVRYRFSHENKLTRVWWERN